MPQFREFTTSTGYTLKYRVLAQDTAAKIEAAIRHEWADRAPKPETMEIETGPGQFETKTLDKAPEHLEALKQFDVEVRAEQIRRMARLMATFAIVTPHDQAEVDAARAAYAATGVDLSDEDDREVWLWRVVLTEQDDQALISGHISGRDIAAYVEAQRRAFRRQVERAADRVHTPAERQMELQPEPALPGGGALEQDDLAAVLQ